MTTQRATRWQLRTKALEFGARPAIMGIVNVTPDSFSDGGHFLDPAAAIEHAEKLVAAGADILDIGGESTRPYADPVGEDEEMRRVIPVISALKDSVSVPLSIDTYKAAVAREAVIAGAEIINDITGLSDPEMMAVARENKAAVCVMHMLGSPRTMQVDPVYDDVVAGVFRFLQQRRDALVTHGIPVEKICLDPGIGFGKTTEHNLELIRNAEHFHKLGCPILFGPSRKRFIGELQGNPEDNRTAGTLGAAATLATAGIQVLRVHDVRQVRNFFRLYEASGGLSEAGS